VALVIAKNKLFAKVGYVPNKAQRRIHASKARFQVVAAGRRTGKSTAGGMELLPECYRAFMQRNRLEDMGLRHEYWIVGPQYTDSEKEFRAFYNKAKYLQMPFDKPGTYYDARGGDMQMSLWGGRFLVKAQSAKYPEHLVGEGLHGVIMAEAAKMKKRIWDQYIRPTLADYRGWAKFNSTPEGRNWFYELWQEAVHSVDPAWLEWEGFRFPSWANERLFPLGENDPEILSMLAGMSPEMGDQEVRAKFSRYVGQVFKDWDEEWHVNGQIATYNPAWPVFLATDYGWTNPNVVLFIQIDPWDHVHVIDEYYQSHRSPEEVAHDLETGAQSAAHPSLVRVASRLYPDPADPAASHTLADRLRLQVQTGTGGEIKTRLEIIRKWLKDENEHLPYDNPDRRPRLIVNPKCRMLVSEMDAYRYPKSKDEQINEPENPLKKDDHAPEALGRFFMGHFGPAATQAPPTMRRMRATRGPRSQRRTGATRTRGR
jgi:hypothetical protein